MVGLVTHPMAGVNEEHLKSILSIPRKARFVIATPLAHPAEGSYDKAAEERLSQRTRKDLEVTGLIQCLGKAILATPACRGRHRLGQL